MRMRQHRRNLVIWSSSAGSADRFGALGLTPRARSGRLRRCIRIGFLLAVMGVLRLARGGRPGRQLALAGAALTVTGTLLRSSPAGVILLPGLMFLLSAPLIPDMPEADRKRHAELARELAAYSTPAQRYDLGATLDQYPDGATYELRDILARQAVAAYGSGIPGNGSFGRSGCP